MCELTNKKLAVIVIGLTIVLLLFMKLNSIEHMSSEDEEKPITKTTNKVRDYGEKIGQTITDFFTKNFDKISNK